MDNKLNGFGPGVNRVISTGSSVIVERAVGGMVGNGVLVLVGCGVPDSGVSVGPGVFVAKRSGVFVHESLTRVTVGAGEFATAGSGVDCCRKGRLILGSPAHPTKSIVMPAKTIFFMNSS